MKYAILLLSIGAFGADHRVKPQAQPLAGVVILCSDGHQAVTDADGNYSITVDLPFTGTLLPVLSGYQFTPFQPSFSNLTTDVTQDFQAKRQQGKPNAGPAAAVQHPSY